MAGKLGEFYRIVESTSRVNKALVEKYKGAVLEVAYESDSSDTYKLFTPNKDDFWYFDEVNVQLIGNSTIATRDFLTKMPKNTDVCVSMYPEYTMVYCSSVEFQCDTQERLEEVMKALLMLFPKE